MCFPLALRAIDIIVIVIYCFSTSTYTSGHNLFWGEGTTKFNLFGDRSMVLSTGAMPCRPVHSIIDRSMPTGVLWFWRFGGRSTLLSQSDRSMVLAVGALFYRQEHYLVDRSHAMSTGAQFYRQEHAHRSIVVSTGALFCRHEHCFVDRSIVSVAGALFWPSLTGAWCWRQAALFLSTGA